MNKDVIVVNESSYDKDCLIWISKSKCNSLQCKNCMKYNLYKNYSEIPYYNRYANIKDLRERRNFNEFANKKRITSI